MIPLAEINQAAEKSKVTPGTIEKDYVICWILRCLSMSGLKDDFIFYGGTAIKRMYFEDHRYSEDIDLISAKTVQPEVLVSELDLSFKKAKENANLVMSVNPARILSSGTRTQVFVEYSGYDEIFGAPKEVRLDFAMGMELYGDTALKGSFASYSDLRGKSGVLPVMTLNTILASKLGLLIDTNRNEPRDIFDIWFLLNRLDRFDFDLGRMREAFKQKNGFFPLFATLRPHLENPTYKKRWEDRLMKQIAELPPFNSVIQDIQRRLKELLCGRDCESVLE